MPETKLVDAIKVHGVTEHLRWAEYTAIAHKDGGDQMWQRIRSVIADCRQQVADIAAGKE